LNCKGRIEIPRAGAAGGGVGRGGAGADAGKIFAATGGFNFKGTTWFGI
jgi:hypothetical protein